MGFFDTEAPKVSFETIGDQVTGTITGRYTERQQTEFGSTSKLKFYSDGRPAMMACVPMQTNRRDPTDPHDDGRRTLYVGSINMRDAIVAAFKAVGADDIEEGATLTVQFVGTEPSGKGQPLKLFTASYQRPLGSLGQQGQAPSNGYATQAPAYPPQPMAGAMVPPVTAQQAYGVPQQPAPQFVPQVPAQAPARASSGSDVGEQIRAIRALSQAGMTPVQISATVPAFTPEAVTAVLAMPA